MAATADALLERLSSAPGATGLFLDFDGVLAPIVARPEDVATPPQTRRELARLAEKHALVSVVAARAVASGLVARFGRKVLKVLPPGAADKGTAVRRALLDRLRTL